MIETYAIVTAAVLTALVLDRCLGEAIRRRAHRQYVEQQVKAFDEFATRIERQPEWQRKSTKGAN